MSLLLDLKQTHLHLYSTFWSRSIFIPNAYHSLALLWSLIKHVTGEYQNINNSYSGLKRPCKKFKINKNNQPLKTPLFPRKHSVWICFLFTSRVNLEFQIAIDIFNLADHIEVTKWTGVIHLRGYVIITIVVLWGGDARDVKAAAAAELLNCIG